MNFNKALNIKELEKRREFRNAIEECNLNFSKKELYILEERFITEGFGQTAKKWIAGAALSIALLGGAHASSVPGLEKIQSQSVAQDIYDTGIEYALKGNDMTTLENKITEMGGDFSSFFKKIKNDVGDKYGKYPTTKEGKKFKIVQGEIVIEKSIGESKIGGRYGISNKSNRWTNI